MVGLPTVTGDSMVQRGGGMGGGEMSRGSTAELSSPLSEPEAPQSFPSPSQQLWNNHEASQHPDSTILFEHFGGENYSLAPPATTTTTLRHTSNLQPQPQQSPSTTIQSNNAATDEQPKIRRPRKKTIVGDAEKEKKEKPARKPRAYTNNAGGPARKKAKLESQTAAIVSTNQSKLSDYPAPPPVAPSNTPTPVIHTPNPADYPIGTHDTPTGGTPAITTTSTTTIPQQQTFRPPSPAPVSRMSYDPVRSMMVERNSVPKVYSTAPPTATPSKSVPLRTSASPAAISHIIDPPPKPNFQTQQLSNAHAPTNDPNNELAASNDASTASVDDDHSSSKAAPVPKKPSSGTPSNAPSPKPARTKEQPPPLPQGSGLLSSALFGNAPSEAATAAEQAPSIVVHVKLKNSDNNIINFAQLAEEKYGFAALYPRLAAQKMRLAQVAAAGAALEKSVNGSRLGGTSAGESADDDLSLDSVRDSDNDGDIAMTGVNGGGTGANSGTDATGPKKRRRKKVEEYDQDDPFVDDSELAWEAQAAAVKDGFFVYCGPLVSEGEKSAVERFVTTTKTPQISLILTNRDHRPDGTAKRGRGRGRGGGAGSRGGRGAAAAAAATATATAAGEGGSYRGGGQGSRGGTTTRKPRVTKASRAIMEREKQDREKMAPLAAKPSTYLTPG